MKATMIFDILKGPQKGLDVLYQIIQFQEKVISYGPVPIIEYKLKWYIEKKIYGYIYNYIGIDGDLSRYIDIYIYIFLCLYEKIKR